METNWTPEEMIEALDELTVYEITEAAYPEVDPDSPDFTDALAAVWEVVYDAV